VRADLRLLAGPWRIGDTWLVSGSDAEGVLHSTLLGDALSNAEVAALIADDEGRYISANAKASELTGYSRAELTRFRSGELAGDEQSARIYAGIATGRKLRGRKLVRRKDGETVSCRYWAIRTRVSRLPFYILLLQPYATE
jgi:PAS domain S-box-containing protein